MAKLIDEGRAAWPGLATVPASFAARVLASDTPVERLHVPDLHLACACHEGAADALAIMDRTILCEVPKYLTRFRQDGAFSDEVTQTLRDKLFVGHAPRIADYSGRGPLRAWVRIAAVRTAVNMLSARQVRPERELDEVDALDVADLALLKARHRGQFREAINDAILALSAKQRTLLRMHHLDGYTLDQLATSYGVHRATIARWIAQAREAVVAAVRKRLAAELALSAGEVDKLAAIVNSQIELSVSRLFGRAR
jgi:RNA polymerase sigma-70 factor (ECF subfamily)